MLEMIIIGDTFETLKRLNRTDEEWVRYLLLQKIDNEKLSENEFCAIVDYLIKKNAPTTIRVLELLGYVKVTGELNVSISDIKMFRSRMLNNINDPADNRAIRVAIYPINKEIRKHLKFWIKEELDTEIMQTETFEQMLDRMNKEINKPKIPSLSKILSDCQDEHICKKTVVDFSVKD